MIQQREDPRFSHKALVTPKPSIMSTQPRVLVVDPDHGIQYFVRALLQGLCLTWAAYSAEMATILLEARPFDLVIIAIDQPEGTDGLEMLQTIRSMPGLEHLPAIGMTFEATDEQRAYLIGQGFNELVLKLPNPLELREATQHVLKIGPASA